MSETGKPVREGRARLRVRDRHRAMRIVRAIVSVLGVVAMASRGAVEVVVDSIPLGPPMRRVSAAAGFVLELAADPTQGLAAIALVATISIAIAAWRRSTAAGTFVAATLLALLDRAPTWLALA